MARVIIDECSLLREHACQAEQRFCSLIGSPEMWSFSAAGRTCDLTGKKANNGYVGERPHCMSIVGWLFQ